MGDKTTIDLTGETSQEIEEDGTIRAVETRLGILSVEPNNPPTSRNYASVRCATSSQTSIQDGTNYAFDKRQGRFDRERSRTLSLSPSAPTARLSSTTHNSFKNQNPTTSQLGNQAETTAANVSEKRKRSGISESFNFRVTKSKSDLHTACNGPKPYFGYMEEIDTISDDENELRNTTREKRQKNMQQENALSSSQRSSSSSRSEPVIQLDSDTDDDDLDPSALFSIVPVNAHRDDDFEILRTITRKANDLSASTHRMSSIKCPDYHCAAGKCVELKNGSFLKITDIIDDNGNTWVVGQHFMRHDKFKVLVDGKLEKDTKWPRRHNELVLMTTRKDGLSTDLVTRPLEEVVKNRCLILTNQTFPAMSSKNHPDSWPKVEQDISDGPLFCRWRQTQVLNQQNKVVEQSIEKIPFEMATDHEQVPDDVVRLIWRNRPTIPGGSHECFIPQVTEDGHCMEQAQQYTFGDTFCGAGGASCGADQAGLHVKFGVDMNEAAISTYRLNFKGAESIVQPIDKFISRADEKDYVVDVLHLSPPCQPFSAAHTRENETNDDKNRATMFAVGDLLDKLKPRIATLEETYGLYNRHNEFFSALVKMFVDHGFSIRWTGARLEEYGLPQKRQRLLIVAAAPGEVLPEFPAITHSAKDPTLRPLVTIHDMISPLPARSTILHHDLKFARYEPHQYKPPYSPHTQAKTITTSGGIGNWHPSGKRQFTVRELAALQRFPTTYKFANTTITNLRRQIGNAVPPYVFKKMYREIIKSLKKTDGVL